MLNQLPKILDRLPKWVWFALGLAFLVGFALLVGYSSAQPPRYPQAHSGTYGTEHESIQDISAQIVARYTEVLAWFTGILALATISLGIGAVIQLNLARREFLSTNRPQIRIKHVVLKNDIWHGEPLVIEITCVNHGTMPAKLEAVGINYHIVEKGRPLPIRTAIKAVRFYKDARLEIGVNYPLGDIEGRTLSMKENADVQQERDELYCVGWVSYRDGLGDLRITGFCRVLRFPPVHVARTIENCRFRRFRDPDYEYQD
jgi:hypothetical protein